MTDFVTTDDLIQQLTDNMNNECPCNRVKNVVVGSLAVVGFVVVAKHVTERFTIRRRKHYDLDD